MKPLFVILLLCLLMGCDPVKRIQRNQERFERLGREWVLQHPRPADTVTVRTTTTQLRVDTLVTEVPVVLPGSNDTMWLRQLVIHHHYRDSVKLLVHDNLRTDAAEKSAQNALNQLGRQEAVARLLEKQLVWAVAFAALLLIILVALLVSKRRIK